MGLLHGIRARLTATLVALVALTAVLLGAGAYLFVDNSLHEQALREAAAQARFDLSVSIPNRNLPDPPSRDDIIDSAPILAWRRGDPDAASGHAPPPHPPP